MLGEQSINPGAYILDQSRVGVPEEVERLTWGSGVGTQLAWEMRHDLPLQRRQWVGTKAPRHGAGRALSPLHICCCPPLHLGHWVR